MDMQTVGARGRLPVVLLIVVTLGLSLFAAPAHAAASGYFSPPYGDRGIDTNANGLYDYLEVSATITVTTPGTFVIIANLLSQNLTTWIAGSSVTVYLDQTTVFGLWLEGIPIRQAGIDGPYRVNWTLLDESYNFLSGAQATTSAYTADQFEQAPVSFAHAVTDEGVDTNGNGLFDLLDINATLDATAAGEYRVQASLSDASMTYWDYAQVDEWFDVGQTAVTLAFDGMRINAAGANGPYAVTLSATDAGTGVLLDQIDHTTAAYVATDFEPTPARLVPPYSDWLNDSNGDGLADWILVDVPLNVTAGGEYRLAGTMVETLTGTWMGYAWDTKTLGPGERSLRLKFSTMAASLAGADGPYHVSLSLYRRDATGTMQLITHDSYNTAVYSASQFGPPSAIIGSPITDAGSDRGSPADGLFDVLEVTVPINVSRAATYELWGAMYLGPWIYDDRSVYLNPGWHNVTLEFSGTEIANSGMDGPYMLEIDLAEEAGGNFLPIQTVFPYMTNPYAASEFQAAAPAELAGIVFSAVPGQPVQGALVNAFNYTSRDNVYASTDAEGRYSLPVFAGDWVVTVSGYQLQDQLRHVTVTDPVTVLNLTLDPIVPQTAAINLTLSDWGSASRERSWIFTWDNASVRQYYDWFYGNRDGYLTTDEFLASQGSASGLPEAVPKESGGLFRIDFQPFALTPGSDGYTWGSVEGPIDDPTPMTGVQTGSFSGSAAAATFHFVEVNVSYDLWYNDRSYRVDLPSGWVATFIAPGPGVAESGLGTGTVFLNPGPDPTPYNETDSVWIAIVAAQYESNPPTIAEVGATPNPAELGGDVAIRANITDDTGVDSAHVAIWDPQGSLLGNFSMTRVDIETYEHVLAPTAAGDYTYLVSARDVFGNGVALAGGFTVQDTTRPVINLVQAFPDPAEAGSPVRLGVSAWDNGATLSVYMEIRNPSGGSVGNFSMTYDPAGVWTYDTSFTDVGTYSYLVTVIDGSGLWATEPGTFTVRDTTAPSVDGLSANPNPIEFGDAVQIAAHAADLVGISSVHVEIRDPHGALVGNFTMAAGTGNSYLYGFTPSAVGTYTFRVTAFDASGNGGSASGTFVVRDTTAPTASAGPDQTVTQGATVTFNGSGSTDNVGVASYAWTFNDGGTKALTGVAPAYTFANVGTFTVSLTVADASGNTATDTMTVTVSALPPTTGSISGTVLDTAGNPVVGASVDLMSGSTEVATTTTDAQGHFAFANVNVGTYSVVAYKSGYDAGSAQVTVVGGQTATSTVHLNLVPVPPPSGGIDWLPILVGIAAVAAVGVGALLLLRRKRS